MISYFKTIFFVFCCRCLKSCYSSDQLNYNSASDTSERYFTPNERDCNGLDTGDDLDNFQDPVVNICLFLYLTIYCSVCLSVSFLFMLCIYVIYMHIYMCTCVCMCREIEREGGRED